MPNWCFNELTVTGDKRTVKKLVAHVARPYEALRDPNGFGTVESPKPFVKETITPEGGFSFMNCISPSDVVSYYCVYRNLDGTEKDNKKVNEGGLNFMSELLFGGMHKSTNGDEVAVGQGWYEWNNANWGTKWDCSNAVFDGNNSWEFDTPWGPPIEAINHLARQFPTLTFTLRYMEEQGWGGVHEWSDGEGCETESWDIPESHADNVKTGRDCQCSYEDDLEYLYDDCPKKLEAIKK
jgi:hypothetical protein